MAERLLRDKIGYKAGQAVLLLDLPEGVDDPFAGVEHTGALAKKAKLGKQKFDLMLAFTRDRAALALAAPVLLGAAADEAKIWLAYPKLSGKIKTDLTRDAGWEPMFDAGYIVVSIAAVDATWSAVRFRPKHLVKSIR
jgi:hypothetical protein